jgi:hypothetical protein
MKNPWIIISAVLGAGLVLVLGILLGQNTSSNKLATEIVPTPVVTVVVTKTPTPTPTPSPTPSKIKSIVTTDQKEGSGQKKLIQTMCSNYFAAIDAWYQANENTYKGGVGVEEGGQQALQQATERLASVIDPKAGNAYIDLKDFVYHLRQIYNAYYPVYDYWTLDGNRPKLIILRDKIENSHC